MTHVLRIRVKAGERDVRIGKKKAGALRKALPDAHPRLGAGQIGR